MEQKKKAASMSDAACCLDRLGGWRVLWNPEAGPPGLDARGDGWASLRLCLHGRFGLRRMVRKLYFAEVECHARDALRDAVRRWHATQIPWRFQGPRANHRGSFSSLSGRMVMSAGATIIARKTRARIKSWIIAKIPLMSGLCRF
jgi:hypothetical protein